MGDTNLNGVVLLARRNVRRRFFLPSKENYFGGWKVEAAMIDNGCNGMLLPLRNKGDLQQLTLHFRESDYNWEIVRGKGVQGPSLSVKITSSITSTIDLDLCRDFAARCQTKVSFLRFHLCTEDLEDLANFPSESIARRALDRFIKTNGEELVKKFLSLPVIRRKHALVGQAIMDDVITLKHLHVFAMLDPKKFVSGIPFESIQAWGKIVREVPEATLPERFEELEDEDHDPNDEEIDIYEMQDFVDE